MANSSIDGGASKGDDTPLSIDICRQQWKNYEKSLGQITYKGVVAAADGLTIAGGATDANDSDGVTVD